jgi:hydrogenase-1 operon protein HyaE
MATRSSRQETFATFCDDTLNAILLCAGDPVQYPETLDIAVVLPELMQAFRGEFQAAIIDKAMEPVVQARFGFNRWPTLIVLRAGGYVGAISGIQDWSHYLERLQELLQAPVRRPPIAISAAPSAAACH